MRHALFQTVEDHFICLCIHSTRTTTATNHPSSCPPIRTRLTTAEAMRSKMLPASRIDSAKRHPTKASSVTQSIRWCPRQRRLHFRHQLVVYPKLLWVAGSSLAEPRQLKNDVSKARQRIVVAKRHRSNDLSIPDRCPA